MWRHGRRENAQALRPRSSGILPWRRCGSGPGGVGPGPTVGRPPGYFAGLLHAELLPGVEGVRHAARRPRGTPGAATGPPLGAKLWL
eukprot:12568145-Alexandrium_andersonii.AAC.1